MFTADDAEVLDAQVWDERIRTAVEKHAGNAPGHSFLNIRPGELAEAVRELERRGFRTYPCKVADDDFDRLPFSWRNHRE